MTTPMPSSPAPAPPGDLEEALRAQGPSPSLLYSPAQIGAAALFGTPIAAAALVGLNVARSGGRRFVVPALFVVAIAEILLSVSFNALVMVALHVVGAALWARGARGAFGFPAPWQRASPVVPVVVSVWAVAGLVAASAAADRIAPGVLPSLVERGLDSVDVGGVSVRVGDGASFEDARRISRAARAALPQGGLRARCVRDVDGALVVELRLPYGDIDDEERKRAIGAVQSFSRRLVDQLEPPECLVVRVVDPGGAERARGRVCPGL